MKNYPKRWKLSYNGEIGRSLIERVNEHDGRDINLHVFKHSIEANYPKVTLDDFSYQQWLPQQEVPEESIRILVYQT